MREAFAMMLGLSLSICNPTLNGGGAPAADHYDYAWVAKNVTAPWSARDGAMAINFAGKWWLTGGWNGGIESGVDTTNQVWSSSDLITWNLELAYDAAPPTSGAGARWKRRHWHGLVPHTHAGTPYVYVLGGDHESVGDGDFSGSGGYQADIWRSADMLTWTRVMASGSAPWAPRMLQAWGSGGGSLWMFGGMDGLLGEVSTNRYNDLWTSTDGGATWSLVSMTNKPTGRGIINKLASWNGRLWLVAGGTYDTTDHPTRDYYREVYSFDPSNTAAGWTKHSTPPWLGTEYNSVEVLNGRLFILGGYSFGINTRTVWSTGDGERWTQHERPPWPRSHADGTTVSGTTLAHVAGNGDIASGVSLSYALEATAVATPTTVPAARAAWSMSSAVLSGSNITSVPDSTGNGHHLVPDTAGDATINASDADYGGAPSANSPDGGHFLHTTDAVDLSSYTLFIVLKPAVTDGLYYVCYSLTTGPTRYMYVAGNRAGADDNELTLSADFYRNAISMTGLQSGIVDQEDIRHVYVVHYTGSAATCSFASTARTSSLTTARSRTTPAPTRGPRFSTSSATTGELGARQGAWPPRASTRC